VLTVRGTTISLHAYTGWNGGDDYTLNGPGGTPLVDGSYVMIVGSSDSNRSPLATFGGTNLISDAVQDETDTIVGTFQLDAGNQGWFDVGGFTYDTNDVSYLYIYFFDSTGWPVEGMHAWGYSPVIDATGWDPFTYSIDVDFTPGGDLSVTATNNFVQIPEPGTGGLLVFFGLMGFFGLPGLIRSCNSGSPKNEPHLKGGGDGGSHEKL
jgi:hypothetical protein